MPEEASVAEVEAGDELIDVCDTEISDDENVADEDLDHVVLYPDGHTPEREAEWKALFDG